MYTSGLKAAIFDYQLTVRQHNILYHCIRLLDLENRDIAVKIVFLMCTR